MKTTAEKGKFKMEIQSALFKNLDLVDLLLGDISTHPNSEKYCLFKEKVKSHLFVDDTILAADSYIFYDVKFPQLHPQIKRCEVILYAITSREGMDEYSKDGYYGDKADIMCQMIENTLINNPETNHSFGIGELSLVNVDIFSSQRFYGSVLRFEVPNFR